MKKWNGFDFRLNSGSCIAIVTVRARTGLRLHVHWIWQRTQPQWETKEVVLWLLN